jgi:PAS domain S-box-containing protein
LINAWLSLESQALWAKYGSSSTAVANVAPTGILMIALRQDYETGVKAQRLVLSVGELRNYEPDTSSARFMYSMFGFPWFGPLDENVLETLKAIEGLLRGGRLLAAGFAYHALAIQLLEISPTLDAVASEVEIGIAFAERTRSDQLYCMLVTHRQYIRALRGETFDPNSFADDSFDDETFFASPALNLMIVTNAHVARARLAAIMGNVDGLAYHASQAMASVRTITGSYEIATINLLTALMLGGQIRVAPSEDRSSMLVEMDALRDWMHRRAAACPENFLHLACFIDAERAWATGDVVAAMSAFDLAQREVAKHVRPWHHAYITERAAIFHLSQGFELGGRTLLAEARRLYKAWGADAKVNKLDEQYPFLRAKAQAASAVSHHGAATVGSTMMNMSSDAIDLIAVLEASQALSSETSLDKLRQRVEEVLAAITGATSVRVLLWNAESGTWSLISSVAGDGNTSIDDAGRAGLLLLSAFHYVERTREPLLVEDAKLDDRFARDPYLAKLDYCSLLAVPVMAHGSPRAMLIMENHLSGGMFTTDRLDAVVLIAAQLAVSLDNALAERFRSLVQRSSDLTLVIDPTGVVSYASAASVDILGFDDSELIGRPVFDLVDEDERTTLVERIRHVQSGDVEVLECRALCADKTFRWVNVSFDNLLSDAAVGGIVLHLRDVTERRKLETELRHAQKLESVGQLSAGIAHEINTPVQFISDNLSFLTSSFEDLRTIINTFQSDPDGAEQVMRDVDAPYLLEEIPIALAQSVDGTSRVAVIVRAMKAFGHPGGEEKALCDLNEAVRNTLIVTNSEIKAHADVVLELGELPPALCNISDINQVILNLVVNAAHAIEEAIKDGRPRGTITVRTHTDGPDIVLEVQDTGSGMPPEVAERVFEQFFTTKAVGSGTGQGLAIAYAIVTDRHGGTISLESELGVGTTFTIRLPQQG